MELMALIWDYHWHVTAPRVKRVRKEVGSEENPGAQVMLEVGQESVGRGLRRRRTREAGGSVGSWVVMRFKKEQRGKHQTLPRGQEREAQRGAHSWEEFSPWRPC